MVDEKKGQPGATKDFLEKGILTESRNRSGFNQEMQEKQSFVDAQVAARKVPGFSFDEDLGPANFVLALNEKIATAEGRDLNELRKIKESLGFEMGTVTMSAVNVTFQERSAIAEADLEDVKDYFSKIFPESLSVLEGLEDKTYQDLYDAIEAFKLTQDPFKQKMLNGLLVKNQAKRFGKIVDLANELVENQKKQQRNSLVIQTVSMRSLDLKGEGQHDARVSDFYSDAVISLDERVDSAVVSAKLLKQPLVEDELAGKYAQVKTEGPEDQAVIGALVDIQKARYVDALTRTFNYEYLTQIVPSQLALADQEDFEFSMVSFDIDNLKAINDTCGHKMGDVALMIVSEVTQRAVDEMSDDLKAKVEATGIKPAVIRATGGEEFIMTLPGLTTEESASFFSLLNENLRKEIRSLTDETTSDGKGTYTDRIKEFIGKLNFQGADGSEVKRGEEEVNKFGSVTAGVVSLSEVRNSIIDENGVNAGKMRQFADMIGEKFKGEINEAEGTSGRGQVWTTKDM